MTTQETVENVDATFDPEAAHRPSGLWGVHSKRDDRPYLRAWAKSEAAGEALIVELKKADQNPANTYWTLELTVGEVAGLKHTGFIPKEA